jgi:DNA gyrase subunit A
MIYETDFQKQIENAFLTYGASVAQERAIPDVRDMLKIGLRQGLYAQYTNKLTHKDKMQKAQKSVAAAMAQSYVHGDAAMYDTFIRAARPWSYRYPVEDVQGNAGNQSAPDSHAAARYVEMRAGEVADLLFDGIKKNAIEEWYSNYDDTEMIPSVFPSIGYWNIVNGCSGIAVALATSVPQFNLKEVNEALIKIIQNPDVDFNSIYCAPDFATGGIITNGAAVKESLRLGNGESVRLQAKLTYVPEQNMIQVTELPYGVFTDTVIKQLKILTNDNPNYGIEKVMDYTQTIAEIRIYLSKGVNVKKMISKLYKDTSLENWFSVNMVLLDKGRFPKVFGWREACDAYIEHIRECKRNIIQFDLDKAIARKNIVDGLIKAYSIIDEVVALIRASESPIEASKKLIETYDFNVEQAKAILAMKLSSLTKLDIVKLEEEAAELVENIKSLTHLLNTPHDLDEELIKTLREVANKFGDERRTKVINLLEEDETADIKEEEIGLLLFDNDSIRAIQKDNLQGGKRGRKGVNIKPPKDSSLINTLYTTNMGTVAVLTSRGRMYHFSLADLEYEKDYSVYELIELQDGEKPILLMDSSSFNSYQNLITVSKNGYIKKSSIAEYSSRSKRGIAAVKLEGDDSIVSIFLSSSDEDKVFIVSSSGNYNFYSLDNINATGRATRGVKGIKLENGENVVSATIIKKNVIYRGLLTIASNGQGKISPIDEFSTTARGAKGRQVMNTKDNSVAAVYAVPDGQEKIYVSAAGKAVIVDIAAIPVQSRVTAGVKIINTISNKIEVM